MEHMSQREATHWFPPFPCQPDTPHIYRPHDDTSHHFSTQGFKRVDCFLDRIRNGAAGDAKDFLLNEGPDPANYKLLPFCRAIMLAFDQQPNYDWNDDDEYLYLDEAIDGMNVIMVLTGEDTALSEPITFESVKARALPLARPDADGCVDVIRVPMAIAVQLMADLL